MLVGVRGVGAPPRAHLGHRVATIGAAPQVDATDDDQVGVGRIPGPDDVPVPALVSQEGRGHTVGVVRLAGGEARPSVGGPPDLPVAVVDRGVDDIGVSGRVGHLDAALPRCGMGGRGPGLSRVDGRPDRAGPQRPGDGAVRVRGVALDVGHGLGQDRGPRGATRIRAPGQPRRPAGEEDLAGGVQGDAVDRGEGRVHGGGQLAPAHPVGGAEESGAANRIDVEEAFTGARVDHVGVGGIHGEGGDREVGHQVVDRLPARARVVGAPHPSTRTRRPDGGGLRGVHDDGPGPAADVARTDRDPAGQAQPGRRSRVHAEARRCHGGSARQPGDGAARGAAYPQAVELADRTQLGVRRDSATFVARLHPPEPLAGLWQVGILQPPQRPREGRLGDRFDRRRRQSPCLVQDPHLLDADTPATGQALVIDGHGATPFLVGCGSWSHVLPGHCRSGPGRRLTRLSRTVSHTGSAAPSRLALRTTAVVPSADALASRV